MKRTASGLNNQHLFHDVDLVVFLEGGPKSFSKVEVFEGNFHSETEDVLFWKNIFNLFKSGVKIKFKSIGSKTTIKEIAVDIVAGKLNTVMVAMDNEFDEILERRMEHSHVFYTHGYSWENDCWNDVVIKAVIEELTAVEIEHDDVRINFDRFLTKMKIAVYADGYLFTKNASFFPREKGHMFCVDCIPKDLPTIKSEQIKLKLVERGLNRKTLYAFGKRHSLSTKKFIYGHLLADYCFQVINNYLKNRHSLPGPRKEIIYRMAINKYFQVSFTDSDIYGYYQAQFLTKGNQ